MNGLRTTLAALTTCVLTFPTGGAPVTLEKIQTIPHPGPVFGSEFGARLALGDANGDGHHPGLFTEKRVKRNRPPV